MTAETYGLTWPGKERAISDASAPVFGSLIRGDPVFEDPVSGGAVLDGAQGDGATPAAGSTFIEGDNLAALKLLLPSYRGSIKMIYIDPPYDTGNKYSYRDDFAAATWLSMMYSRLLLARELLRDDGLIFISINDVELANLTLLCREIFGPGNHLNTIIWHYGKMSNEHHRLPNNHEYVLVFRKTPLGKITAKVKKEDSEYRNRYHRFLTPDNKVLYGAVKRSTDRLIALRVAKVAKELGKTELADDDILFDFDKEYKSHSDVIYVPHLKGNSGERISAFGTGQKPLALMELLLQFGAPNPDAIVLDFFAGTGTTGEAVVRLNAKDGGRRSFILIQSAEPLKAAVNKPSGETAETEQTTIADLCRARLSRACAEFTTYRIAQDPVKVP
ncbi:MAG: site-specific DNA-methyltransferase [Cellulomonadaceae bacterium]|nr:site-specific DNA-methyltransferase [Cellulomonadaceae bacterium]